MGELKNKYDRQLRIWGEHGQAALERASICLLNCGPTGSETLKNLVIGGVGSITIVDGSKVELGDLGNNFLLDGKFVGESKAKCVCALLEDLNEGVKARFIEEDPETLINTRASFFFEFTLVVATQLVEEAMLKLDKICRAGNITLIFARSYGLTGFVRVSVKEHTVIESKPDHFLDDLRLNNPWPELKRFSEEIDIDVADPIVHKHIPYVVILVRVVEEWKQKHCGNLPLTREEKKELKDILKKRKISEDEDNYKEAVDASFKVFASRGISSTLVKIVNDICSEVDASSADFWVMVSALREFIAFDGDGEAPLEGSIPDMTSSTENFIILQKLYQDKAESDFLVLEQRVRNILKRLGRDRSGISKEKIKSFCKNARKLAVCRYRSLDDEFKCPTLQKYLIDEESCLCAGFYILLRAVDRFYATYDKFPGQFEGKCGGVDEEDVCRLKTAAVGLLSDMGCSAPCLIDDLVDEMCRYGASEIHVVAAFIGGVASQEVIKLITQQFEPMRGTFIFNGIDNTSQMLFL